MQGLQQVYEAIFHPTVYTFKNQQEAKKILITTQPNNLWALYFFYLLLIIKSSTHKVCMHFHTHRHETKIYRHTIWTVYT